MLAVVISLLFGFAAFAAAAVIAASAQTGWHRFQAIRAQLRLLDRARLSPAACPAPRLRGSPAAA